MWKCEKVYKGRNFSGFGEFNLEWSCYGKSWMGLGFHRNGDEGSSIPCPQAKILAALAMSGRAF